MAANSQIPGDFDVVGLWEAVDAAREAQGMTWSQVTKTLGWMNQQTITRMRDTGMATCNHVLPMIQWVGRTPESFTVAPDGAVHELLPDPLGPNDGWNHQREGKWRWWWNHRELANEVDQRRQNQEMNWKQVAAEVRYPLQGINKSNYGPPIAVAMIAARWVGRSAASFMTETPPALLNG